jgi:hypothetical protein
MVIDSPVRVTLYRDLGDGLVLRSATVADSEALVDFNARIHSDDGADKPDERIAAWTRDLLEKPHPTFSPGDFTIVEDTHNKKIVSSLNLIAQTWQYGGIDIGVGRPELVGTLPEFRNRGLVRAQFDVIHEWSAQRGHLIQGITGIPYYYRQFGYEMALGLGGGRVGYKPHVPRLKEGEVEPYSVRKAEVQDIPFLIQIYQHASQRYLISCLWDRELWSYELNGKHEQNVNRAVVCVIENPAGEKVGALTHSHTLWGPTLPAFSFEVIPGISWGAVAPSVVRYLFSTGEAYAARDGKSNEFAAFAFWLGSAHPVYEVLKERLPRVRQPYAWYIRVPDLPGFLAHISPALERRLADSYFPNHTGELKLTFYRTGLRLVFNQGKLVTAESWRPQPQGHSGDAAFPDLTFLQLLFGYRSFDELRYAFVDCWADNEEAGALLQALFPKHPSDIMAVS